MAKKERVPGKPWSDESLYEQLSTPKKKDEAELALAAFVAGVEALRKECGVPEVLLACTCHVVNDAGEQIPSPVSMLALGNPNVAIELGAIVFKKYTLPAIKRGEALRASAAGEVVED